MNSKIARVVESFPSRFVELAKLFKEKTDAKIDMKIRKIGNELVETDLPRVFNASGPKGEGFYIRAQGGYMFGPSRKELEDVLPITIGGFTFECTGFGHYEIDDDRTWAESISFIIKTNGRNILS